VLYLNLPYTSDNNNIVGKLFVLYAMDFSYGMSNLLNRHKNWVMIVNTVFLCIIPIRLNPGNIVVCFVLFRARTGDSGLWTRGEEVEVVEAPGGAAALRTRTIEYTGEFVPVSRTCRAPLPSGSLCPRQDRYKV